MKVIDAPDIKAASAFAWSGGPDGKDWAAKAFLAAPYACAPVYSPASMPRRSAPIRSSWFPPPPR